MSQKPKAVMPPRPAAVQKPVVVKTAAPVVTPAPALAKPAVPPPPAVVETPAPVLKAAPVAPAAPIVTVPKPVPAVAKEVVMTAPVSKTVQPNPSNPIQGLKTMMKTSEEFVAFGQANMEAFMKSSQIWAAGVQELTKALTSTAKLSFDESVTTFKAISTAKSVKEAMELQSTFAKTSFEKAVAESKQLADASIKLTEKALAPITARVTVAVETLGKAA